MTYSCSGTLVDLESKCADGAYNVCGKGFTLDELMAKLREQIEWGLHLEDSVGVKTPAKLVLTITTDE